MLTIHSDQNCCFPGPLAQRFGGCIYWPKLQKAPACAFDVCNLLYVEWLFEAQRGPEKSNFWIILAQRPVMSSFGGRRYLPKFSKAPVCFPVNLKYLCQRDIPVMRKNLVIS